MIKMGDDGKVTGGSFEEYRANVRKQVEMSRIPKVGRKKNKIKSAKSSSRLGATISKALHAKLVNRGILKQSQATVTIPSVKMASHWDEKSVYFND